MKISGTAETAEHGGGLGICTEVAGHDVVTNRGCTETETEVAAAEGPKPLVLSQHCLHHQGMPPWLRELKHPYDHKCK